VLGDRFFGQSSFATLAVATQGNVVRVSSQLPLEMMGPLGCGITTGAGSVWNALSAEPGSTLAVFGAGTVGLSAVMAARVAGCAEVIAVDVNGRRLEKALAVGATHTVAIGPDADRAKIQQLVRASVACGVDYAIDTTGVSSVIEGAFASLAQSGTLALVASSHLEQKLELPMFDLVTGCRTVVGVIEGGGSAHVLIPKIIALQAANLFPFEELLTFYDLDQINLAVADVREGSTIKAVLRMGRACASQDS
jgi:aryl-alcohol dehydrogenase